MNTVRLDEYDRKIVELLQEDSSISNIDLSKKIGLGPSSCSLRVKNLKEQNILKKFTVIVDERNWAMRLLALRKYTLHP